MQHVMATESGHRLERRATADAEVVALLEQPLPHEPAMMAMVLVHVKPEGRALHDPPLPTSGPKLMPSCYGGSIHASFFANSAASGW